jgi:hypothetical protein
MATTLRTIKMLLEDLTGQRRRPLQGLGAPQVYMQVLAPDPRTGVQLKRGDLWINPQSAQMFFWDSKWVQVQP